MNANPWWRPLDRTERRERLLRFAREFGSGLADYSDKEIRSILNSTYSRVVVRYTFDSVGPTLDTKDWVSAIEGAIRRTRKNRAARPV